MSQMAWGYCDITLKTRPTDKLLEHIESEFSEVFYLYPKLTFSMDGNYWFNDVVSELNKFTACVESGFCDFSGDEDGHCRSEFINGKWTEEYAHEYYESDMPLNGIVSTQRAAEIINAVVDDLMDGSDSEQARRILFHRCHLTPAETNALGLDWLKDLEGVPA